MFSRSTVLVLSFVAVLCGCSFVGRSEVRVETGNQTTGYLSRPMGVTLASDESVEEVAQKICDNVKAGSEAKITFVGKIPGPGPFDFSDWGRYRYECLAPAVAANPSPAVKTSSVVPSPASEPKGLATTPPIAKGDPAVPTPIAASKGTSSEAPPIVRADPVSPIPAGAPKGNSSGDEPHKRECVFQQGKYYICLGDCMINSASPSDAVAGECQQHCAPKAPVGCN